MNDAQVKGNTLLSMRAKLASMLISCNRDKNFVHEVCNKLDVTAPDERPKLLEESFGAMVAERCFPILQQLATLEAEILAAEQSAEDA